MEDHTIMLPGFTGQLSFLSRTTTYAKRGFHFCNNLPKVSPSQRWRCCEDCEDICYPCQECYRVYVYTGREPPEFCYDSPECKECNSCERSCRPCPIEP